MNQLNALLNRITGAVDPMGGRSSRRDLVRFYRFVAPHTRFAVYAGLAMGTSVLLALPVPLLTMYVIDDVLPSQDHRMLILVCGVVLAILLIRTASAFLQQFYFSKLKVKVVFGLRNQTLKQVLSLPMSFFQKHHSAYLASRIAKDCERATQGLLADSLLAFARECLTFLFGLVILFFLHVKLTVLICLLLPFFLLSVLNANRLVRRCSNEALENSAVSQKSLQETLGAAYVVKAFVAEKREVLKNMRRLREALSAGRKTEMVSSAASLLSSFIGALAPVIIILYGGLEVMRQNLTVGQLVAFSSYIAYLFGPVERLVTLNLIVQGSLAALARVFELLDLAPADRLQLNLPSRRPESLEGSIEFRDVIFRYAPDKPPVLSGVNLKVEAGETVAVIGPSGIGKTTLLNLMLGLASPSEGQVLVDGLDVRELSPAWLRRQIGLVPQEQLLFTGTIAENIRFGRPGASREDVLQAARAANAHEFIDQLKDGYESLIGERGAGLSTGQKQRLCIARAILPDPSILILDEATCSVDPQSERMIQQAISSATKNRTCIIVGHRLSSVQIAERIVALNGQGILQPVARSQLRKVLENPSHGAPPQSRSAAACA